MGEKLIIIISKIYWYFRGISWELDNFRYHFVAVYLNNKFKVQLLQHYEYIEITKKTLARMFINLPREEFIKAALDKTENCKFITFSNPNDDFVQFWRGDGKITLDFPMSKTNSLGKYKYQVLGRIAEEGLVKNTSPILFPERTFKIDQETDGEIIKANFGKDSETASKVTIDIFIKFFNCDLNNLQYQIG